MNYNDWHHLIGRLLAMDEHPESIAEIKVLLMQESFDWEQFVRYSSGQLVVPALYVQLKKAELLSFLPVDLVEYLEEIAKANRARNQQILNQVDEIVTMLNQNGIVPLFLKGTAHLLLSLYEDHAERMIGDIDFFVPEEDVLKTAQLFMDQGYHPIVQYKPDMRKSWKHYPRLVNYNYSAAIEIHWEAIEGKSSQHFSGKDILANRQRLPGAQEMYVPCDQHLLIHNMMNGQINDKAYLNCMVLQRQIYDFMLLAKRADVQKVFGDFDHCKQEADAWLAVSSDLMNLSYLAPDRPTFYLRWYLKCFYFLQSHPYLLSAYRTTIYLFRRFVQYFSIAALFLFSKEKRKELRVKLSDPDWFKNHLESYRNFFGGN